MKETDARSPAVLPEEKNKKSKKDKKRKKELKKALKLEKFRVKAPEAAESAEPSAAEAAPEPFPHSAPVFAEEGPWSAEPEPESAPEPAPGKKDLKRLKKLLPAAALAFAGAFFLSKLLRGR